MRAIPVLTAALLIAGGLTAVAPAATADPPTYTAVTGSVDPITGGTPFAYANTVQVDNTTAGQLTFTANPASTTAPVTTVTAPTAGFAADTDYASTDAPPIGSPATFAFSEDGTPCSAPGWTMHVDDLATAAGTITEFGAHYTVTCGGSALPVTSGELRFASTTAYAAVTQSVSSWDFGNQLVKHDGWAKKVTFTNAGTTTQHFGAASTGSSAFKIKSNGCTVAAGVAAGKTCTITVVPHATGTSAAALGTLHITPTGLPRLDVPLRVLGSDVPPLYVSPGAERVTLNWSQFLPMVIGGSLGSVRIYRGTSARSLAYLRSVGGGRLSLTDTGRKAGVTYYYAIRPVDLFTSVIGDYSPVVAARPWPKYSAGMYHRLGTATRLVTSHRVLAGHPYALRVTGTAGIPSSHVSAVALTVTAASPTSSTQVYAYPSGTKRPAAADLSVQRGDTRSNFVLAKVGSHGRVLIATRHGSVPVTVDVAGYFSAAGLSAKYGQGGALHEYGWPGTILDTTKWKTPVLHAGYYVNAPVNFDPSFAHHVTSLLVEVTAFGSKGSGTITGFATNRRPRKTSVLAYRPHVTTSSTAIIRAGLWYSSYDGNDYPSISLLNQGKTPVQLVVTILGYFDDNAVLFGQRYTPTAARHLFGAKIASGGNRTIHPGSAGGYWTSAFNEKLSAANPAKTTTVSLRGLGLGPAPSRGQLHAPAHVSTVASTIGVTGAHGNQIVVHNAGGTARIDVWSFGRFDAYPVPTTLDYASVTGRPVPATAPTGVPGSAPGAVRYRQR